MANRLLLPRAGRPGLEWFQGRRRATDGRMYSRHGARQPRRPRAVAVVPRSVANSPPRGGAGVRGVLLAAVLLVTAGRAAGALDVDLKSYDEARRRGETATISGRVYAERRKPSADDMPMPNATVGVLPRSGALGRRLDGLRAAGRGPAHASPGPATA